MVDDLAVVMQPHQQIATVWQDSRPVVESSGSVWGPSCTPANAKSQTSKACAEAIPPWVRIPPPLLVGKPPMDGQIEVQHDQVSRDETDEPRVA